MRRARAFGSSPRRRPRHSTHDETPSAHQPHAPAIIFLRPQPIYPSALGIAFPLLLYFYTSIRAIYPSPAPGGSQSKQKRQAKFEQSRANAIAIAIARLALGAQAQVHSCVVSCVLLVVMLYSAVLSNHMIWAALRPRSQPSSLYPPGPSLCARPIRDTPHRKCRLRLQRLAPLSPKPYAHSSRTETRFHSLSSNCRLCPVQSVEASRKLPESSSP